MADVYEHKNPAVKWCLQRVFKNLDTVFVNQAHPEPAFYQQSALYYGFSKEARIDTFEEYIPLPFNLFNILKFAGNEAKKKRNYLLKPLSRDLYDKFRKLYPHRKRIEWEEEVDYNEILSDPKKSLLNEFEEYHLPMDYSKWKVKIFQYIEDQRYEDAIFLLNHLFMGDVDDPPEKMQQELTTRYCQEFNINPGKVKYNVLVVDDFFFLHIYQFSLLERLEGNYDEESGFISPGVHFHFECVAESAIKRIEDKKTHYDLVLLDIDFGQQQSNAKEVAKIARRKNIPFCMFSKFDRADEYDPFWGALPRIKKDLDYGKIYKELQERFEIINNIKKEKRIYEEIKKAKKSHKALLPKKVPQIKGLDIWGNCFSDYDIPSGYYDYIYDEKAYPEIFLFVLGDCILQRGITVPFIMSSIHAGLRRGIFKEKIPDSEKVVKTLEEKIPNPEQVVKSINKILCEKNTEGWLINFFYGELNLSERELHYIRAGGFLPFVVSSHEEIQELRSSGRELGYFPDGTRSSKKIIIEEGDIICLYNHGVTKALGSEDEKLGLTRLKDVIKGHRERKASEIGNKIIEELKRFANRTEKKLDITLLIIKYE